MLLSSVIIILREVLEAALLFSILLAFSKQLNINFKWFGLSVLLGFPCALFYALNLAEISNWFEGVGQEVSNALIQYIIYFLLVLFMFHYVRLKSISQFKISSTNVFILLISLILSLAIIREGSEVILYIISASHQKEHIFPVIIGALIGSGIGISIGFIFYYLLISLSLKWSKITGLTLLTLVSAGMISQATQLLIQADWLPSQLPLWNTGEWLSEKSIVGQLLYALIGYEATPTPLQFTLYLIGLFLPVSLLVIQAKITPLDTNTSSSEKLSMEQK